MDTLHDIEGTGVLSRPQIQEEKPTISPEEDGDQDHEASRTPISYGNVDKGHECGEGL